MSYYGTPDFQPIQGTSLTYAANTAIPVIYVPGNAYYAVQNGVWFTSAIAERPVGCSGDRAAGDLHDSA